MNDNKYSSRKRGNKWESRLRIDGEQYSLYDVDEKKLQVRIKNVENFLKELKNVENQYRALSETVDILNYEYNLELFNKAKRIYEGLLVLIDNSKGKLFNYISNIYSNIDNYHIKLSNYKDSNILKERKLVKDWFYEWLWNYKRFKAGTTFKGYVGKTKKHIISRIGEKYLDEVTREDIQEKIINKMNENEYDPSTIKQVYLLVEECFAQAVKSKYLKETPVVDIERPALTGKTMEAVDVDVEKKLIEIFKNNEMCYPFGVLIDTGLRTSELCRNKMEKC